MSNLLVMMSESYKGNEGGVGWGGVGGDDLGGENGGQGSRSGRLVEFKESCRVFISGSWRTTFI